MFILSQHSDSIGTLTVVKEQLRILADASPITSDVFERIEALRESVYHSADYNDRLDALP